MALATATLYSYMKIYMNMFILIYKKNEDNVRNVWTENTYCHTNYLDVLYFCISCLPYSNILSVCAAFFKKPYLQLSIIKV